MEWFSGSDVQSLVVPKGLDGFPPFHWDFKTEMKSKNMRSEDCEVSQYVDSRYFGMLMELDNEAIGPGFRCNMEQWSSYPAEQPEFHLENMTSLDQLDDVFLSSLLEECPTGMDTSDESSDLSTSSHCMMLLADNNQAGDKKVTNNTCAANLSPLDSYLLEKASPPEVAVKLEHDRGDSRMSEREISMEESVLQNLENLTSQMTERTRNCLRDALYRLADNSKHDACESVVAGQSYRRFGREETRELGTNVIDRTVANLLFSNIDSPS